jgi:ADP-ribose pyrophosphatase YjhB (NUDIX family)
MRVSTRALIIVDGKILTIYRNRGNGQEYYAFPGGGLESKETFEQCVVREVFEETGLTVVPERKFAVINSVDSEQHFYLCKVINGTVGTGVGLEIIKYSPVEYLPFFVDFSALEAKDNIIKKVGLLYYLQKYITDYSDENMPYVIYEDRKLL